MNMENHRIYGQNAHKHYNRASIENLSEDFIHMIGKFAKLCQGSKIADVGCGTGRDLDYMHSEMGRSTVSYGVDASSGMTELASDKNDSSLTEYIKSDMVRLPFVNSKLGGVWCQASIFMVNFEMMRRTLREFNRVLEKSGILSVSFKLSDKVSSDNGEQSRERWGSEVTYHFVDEDIAVNMVEEAGFQVFDTDKTGFKQTEFINVWARVE